MNILIDHIGIMPSLVADLKQSNEKVIVLVAGVLVYKALHDCSRGQFRADLS